MLWHLKRVQAYCTVIFKRLLNRRIPERVNYINSEALAIELGIKIEHSYTNDSFSYTNLIRTRVSGHAKPTRIAGSIFGHNQPRLINILGYDIDVTPYGCLLLTKNIDIPGVIGKIGTILGKHKINISGYILSKTDKGQAFSVIRVENFISDETIEEIINLKEIISVQQVTCEDQ